MYKIEIGNKTGEKREFECDGTANIYALFRELNITDYPYRLKVGQNKNGVSVRIVSDNDFDESIAKILKENRNTLSDALTVSSAINRLGATEDAISENLYKLTAVMEFAGLFAFFWEVDYMLF